MAIQRVEILFDDEAMTVNVNASAADPVTAVWMLRQAETVFLKPSKSSGVILAGPTPPAMPPLPRR